MAREQSRTANREWVLLRRPAASGATLNGFELRGLRKMDENPDATEGARAQVRWREPLLLIAYVWQMLYYGAVGLAEALHGARGDVVLLQGDDAVVEHHLLPLELVQLLVEEDVGAVARGQR
jgi:hypothetical protein